MIRKLGGLLLLSLIWIVTGGCTRYINHAAQDKQTDFILLNNQTSLGQTFTARFDGLAGINLILKSTDSTLSSNPGEIILHLRASPQSSQDLRSVALPIPQVAASSNYRFFFQPLPDSNQRDYYLSLEMTGPGEIAIAKAESATYPDGALYKNGLPVDGQFTFGLKYDSVSLYQGLIIEISGWVIWLLVSLFLFVLPGWGLLSLAWSGWQELDFWGKFSLGSGASLAIYPVLFLFTDLVGLHLGALYAWLPPALGLGVIIGRNYQALIHKLSPRIKKYTPLVLMPTDHPPNLAREEEPVFLAVKIEKIAAVLAFISLVGIIVFSRLWIIRSLDFPLWGDSYQHTMIAQLLVDNRGLFQSWLPYAELSTFTYHFGFHTLAACFNWISGMPMEKAILWVGQMINILAIISLYPLTHKLGKNRWSGALMLLIAGLISPMPMSYVNWGRYTQLAGQAILPAAVFCFWQLLQADRLDRRSVVAYWIILGGLALTHYRVLIFMLLFMAAFIIINWKFQPRRRLFQRLFWINIGGALLFLPWFIAIFPYNTIHKFIEQLTTFPTQAASLLDEYNKLGNPLEIFPLLIWLFVPIIIAWTIWKREKNYATVIVWWILIFLIANPQRFGLPGAGIINNFSIEIGFYIPFSILIGAILARAFGDLETRLLQAPQLKPALKMTLVISGAIIILACLAALTNSLTRQRLDDIRPKQYALMTRPDARAMSWIRQNTNPDDRFLVNSFFAYGGSLIAGSDGGWWLPVFAKRLNTQPPLNYGSEEGFATQYIAQTNKFIETFEQKKSSDPDITNWLVSNKINYIYIGQQQGRVNSPCALVEINWLKNNPRVQLVYRQDHVWIFQINY